MNAAPFKVQICTNQPFPSAQVERTHVSENRHSTPTDHLADPQRSPGVYTKMAGLYAE